MDAVPIRAARRGDVPSLLLLFQAMTAENARIDARFAVHPDAAEHMSRAFLSWVDDPNRVVLVAEEGQRLLVGYAAGVLSPGDGLGAHARIGQVTDCFVVPARRRKGVARRLAGRLFDLLLERGAEAVRLQVVAQNEAARAFWASLGYAPLQEILERAVGAASGAGAAAPHPAPPPPPPASSG